MLSALYSSIRRKKKSQQIFILPVLVYFQSRINENVHPLSAAPKMKELLSLDVSSLFQLPRIAKG